MSKPSAHSVNQGDGRLVTTTTQVGLTTIRVHSPNGINVMTPQERQAWFDAEYEKGNPAVIELVETALEMHLRAEEREEQQTQTGSK